MTGSGEVPAIREARAADAGLLGRLYQAWHEEDREPDREPDPGYLDAFAAWFGQQLAQRLVWLADEAGGDPVGFADAEIRTRRPRPGVPPSRWAYLEGLYVLPGYRGRGTGATLLSALLSDATRQGLAAVLLHPTPRSIPLYAREGFTVLPPETKDRMVKTLRSGQ